MRSEHLPTASPSSRLGEVIITISDARMGVAVILDEGKIAGIVTDGDVRRAMLKYGARFFDITADEIMTRTPKTVSVADRLTDAEQLMQDNKIADCGGPRRKAGGHRRALRPDAQREITG